MKQVKYAMLLLVVFSTLTACRHHETYADKKKKERSAIVEYLTTEGIKVISEDEFKANGYTTDVSQNEFVLFQGSGVYMQIVREGCGEKIQDGETVTVLCRFTETNLLTGEVILSNEVLLYSSIVDKMTVTNTSGSYTASFIAGQSVMYSTYGTASVPSGWLAPLPYVKIGRITQEGEDIAKVRLIVPHTQGQSAASSSVYPCHYSLTFERGRE